MPLNFSCYSCHNSLAIAQIEKSRIARVNESFVSKATNLVNSYGLKRKRNSQDALPNVATQAARA